MEQKIILCGNVWSRPMRTVRAFCALAALEYTLQEYKYAENAHRSEAYLKLNPFGLFPALKLNESQSIGDANAIMRYLAEKHQAYEFWPQNPEQRALVDFKMEWASADFRSAWNNILSPMELKSIAFPEAYYEQAYLRLNKCYAKLEADLRDRKTEYWVSDKITLADIRLYYELKAKYLVKDGSRLGEYENVDKFYKKIDRIEVVSELEQECAKLIDEFYGSL